MPAAPLLLGLAEAEDVLDALRRAPRLRRREPHRRSGLSPTYDSRDGGPDPAGAERLEACWPARLGETARSHTVAIYDRRDWRNQLHTGRRLRIEGWLEVAP